jgi:hypothetical protein
MSYQLTTAAFEWHRPHQGRITPEPSISFKEPVQTSLHRHPFRFVSVFAAVHPRWSAHWVGPSSHSYSGPYSPDLPRICSPPTMGGSLHLAVPTLDRQAVFDGARCLRTYNVLVLGTSPGWAGFSGRRDSKARPLLCTSFSDFQRRPDRI